MVDKERFMTLSWKGEWESEVYIPYFKREVKGLEEQPTLEAFLEALREIEYTKGKRYGFYLLARRAYSSAQLREKLATRRFSDESLDRLITYFQELGALQDESVAEAHLRRELAKGYGPAIAIPKVAHKIGVSREVLEDLWEQFDEEEIEAAISKLIQKKSKRLDQFQIISYVRGRGFFDQNIVNKILNI